MLRLLKWVGLALLTVIVAGLVYVFGWPWVPVLQDDLSSKKYEAYLSENHFKVDLDSPQFAFDDAFYDHKIFLLAEIHGYALPQELDFALLTHLNERENVTHYLAEMDPAQAIAVNTFLEFQDDTWLHEVFDYYADETAQWGNQEFFKKIERVQALNEQLPANQKIYFLGVDRIYDRELAERILASVAGGPVRDGLTGGMLADEEDGIYLEPWIDVHNLNVSLLTDGLERDENSSRYDHIVPNIKTLLRELPEQAKLYGLWGIFHGIQVPVNGVEPLAMRLEALREEEEIVTLAALYADGSMSMMPAAFLPEFARGSNGEPYTLVPANNDDVYLFYNRGIRDLKKVAGEAPVSIFNLDTEGSPYKSADRLLASRGFLAEMQKFSVEGNTADAAEYIVLFQKSPALTPWRGEAYDVTGQQ